jgi:hypothetical protein
MKTTKAIQVKESFENYMTAKGLNRFIHLQFAKAYSDCLPEHVEVEGLECNLDFFNKDFVDNRALLCMASLIGDYNGFNAKAVEQIVAYFGDDAEYSFGREGSPVIYVKPGKRVWINRRQETKLESLADEVSFEAKLGLFRLWFD